MKKLAPRIIAAVLSVLMLCGIVAVAAYTAGANNSESKKVSDSAVRAEAQDSVSSGDTLTKEETVYVIADAEGAAEKVIVSDWLKNPDKLDTITDKSNLKDIENLKGDEKYTMDKDNAVIWDAQGNDIYYNGTTEKSLPVDLTLSYKLDGKSISADELAGKSGKVTIRFDYKNNETKTVKINGKDEEICVPFVMLTGMILSNDKFSNVTVSNGKVINSGERTIVAGFALPGISDSLKLDTDELEIPDYVEINADVKDFELTTTLTLATNEVFNDIDFDKADEKIDELEDKLDKLADATDKLIDGSSQLYTGIHTLLEKSGTLVSGVKSLAAGAKALNSGAESLDDGAQILNKGAKKLNKGIQALDKGAKKLDKGAGQLDTGALSLNNGATQLEAGIKQLAAGLGTISANSSTLNSGAKQVFTALLSTADAQLAAAGLTVDKLTIENYSEKLGEVEASLGEESVRTLATKTARETVSATVRAQESLVKGQVTAAVQQNVLKAVLAQSGLGMDVDAYNTAVAAGQVPEAVQAQITAAVEKQMNTSEIKATITSETEKQIEALIDSNMKTKEVTDQIDAAVEKAKAGQTSITALKQQLDSYNTFYNGLLQYTGGVDTANSGAKQLVSGSGELTAGTGTLKSGTKSLKSGTSDLKKGTKKLKKGSAQLASGTEKLAGGTKQLADGSLTLFKGVEKLVTGSGALVNGVKKLDSGAMQLSNGLKQYKREGVQKLVDAANGDIKSLVERLKAISKASAEYKTFTGTGEGMDGQVNFIYKTDSIEKDDD